MASVTPTEEHKAHQRASACRLTSAAGLTEITDLVRRVAVSGYGHRTMIFGFLRQNLKTKAVAVAYSMAWRRAGIESRDRDVPGDGAAGAPERLAAFRSELYWCFTRRADALFELADAVLCAGGPVRTLAGLSLVPEHRRGHGGLYDAVNAGRMEVARLRWSLAVLPLPC